MHKFIALLSVILLSACQTVPQSSGFSSKQVQVLVAEGFVEADGNYELGLSNRVLFDFGESGLKPDVKTELARLSITLLDIGIGGATVEGHTDNQGPSEYNRKLSDLRAEAVKSVLVESGMDSAKIRTVGFGETDPIEDNSTEEGRSENRRVVLVVSPLDAIAY